MRALITGVAGQDGTLLSKELLRNGWVVFGTKLPFEELHQTHALSDSLIIDLDITDAKELQTTLLDCKPNVIFHFAAMSSVGGSWKECARTMHVNLVGTANLLESIADNAPHAHLINAASTEIFGSESKNLDENSALAPNSPYGISKAAAFELCNAYRDRKMVKATNAILANHESYLRSDTFVTGKIAKCVARISLGLENEMVLGNIDVSRNWSAASDFMLAFRKIAETNYIGNIILANNSSTHLSDIIRSAFESVSICDWENYVRTSEELVRQNDTRSQTIDTSVAKKYLDWEATTPMNVWIGEMVAHHVRELKSSLDS